MEMNWAMFLGANDANMATFKLPILCKKQAQHWTVASIMYSSVVSTMLLTSGCNYSTVWWLLQ